MGFTATWLASYPSHWLDYAAIFADLLPRSFPRRLFRRGGKAWGDLQATGEIIGHARAYLEQVFGWFIPARDDVAALLPWWESWLGLAAVATVAERQAAVLLALRTHGTLLDSLIKAMAAPAYTPSDASKLHLTAPTMADILAQSPPTNDPGRQAVFTFEVYPEDGAGMTLDYRVADEVKKRMPAPYFVTIAESQVLKAGMPINRGVAGAEP